jgi:hypothetical protein
MELLHKYEACLTEIRAGSLEGRTLRSLELILSQKMFELSNFWNFEMASSSDTVIKRRLCFFERELTTVENILISRGILDHAIA